MARLLSVNVGLPRDILWNGKTVHTSVIGKKDLETGEPLALDTIFRIFSMTKPVTGVAMSILLGEGKWSPDDLVLP